MLFGKIDSCLENVSVRWLCHRKISTNVGSVNGNCPHEMSFESIEILIMCSVGGQQRRRFETVTSLRPKERDYVIKDESASQEVRSQQVLLEPRI
jgi:hypothetical protein